MLSLQTRRALGLFVRLTAGQLNVNSSLCIGVGAGALACSGGAGNNGPTDGLGGSGGSGGDGWSAGPGNHTISNALSDVAAVNDTAESTEQVILLDVGGMKCGGCVGHVKQLLEQQAGVIHATVNLATETALVRVILAPAADLDKLAAQLAQLLTKAGFAAAPRERRGSGWVSEAALNHKRQQKLDRLHKTTQDLVVAWGLSLVCGLGHLAHVWPGAPAWMHLLHHPVLAAGLSAAALLGTKVTAGTLNCDGSLMVSAEASGQDTVIADIVRLVEAAQAHTAPIQRLADTVAGKFAYGVMGLSAATFTFWSTVDTVVFDKTGTLTAGKPVVFVGIDGCVVGLLDVADIIRADARSTVQELQQQGIRTVMLSGDRQEAALKVAEAVGISAADVHAGIKPAGKAALVQQLKSSGRRVAMVGDGINDTAALAAAHVGMAMAGGVDAASDVAKVVLMGDQLHQVSDVIELSKKTLRKITQNLGWAFCYNLVGIPLAAGALLPQYGVALTPSISGALMGQVYLQQPQAPVSQSHQCFFHPQQPTQYQSRLSEL
eukprot:gene4232-4481_t